MICGGMTGIELQNRCTASLLNPAYLALLQRAPANAHFRTATVFTASSNLLSSRPKTPCLRPLAEISALGCPAERRHGFQ
jgi:hypothetical protein